MVQERSVVVRMPKAFKDEVAKKVQKEGITFSEAVRKSLSKEYGVVSIVKGKTVRTYRVNQGTIKK